jgi:hypothetical protein
MVPSVHYLAPCHLICSVLHGDVWSGNVSAVDGEPCIFDPATYVSELSNAQYLPKDHRHLLLAHALHLQEYALEHTLVVHTLRLQ